MFFPVWSFVVYALFRFSFHGNFMVFPTETGPMPPSMTSTSTPTAFGETKLINRRSMRLGKKNEARLGA